MYVQSKAEAVSDSDNIRVSPDDHVRMSEQDFSIALLYNIPLFCIFDSSVGLVPRF